MLNLLFYLSILASIQVVCNLPTGNHITLKKIHNQNVMEYTLDPKVSRAFNEILKDQTTDAYKEWDYYKSFAKNALNSVLPEDLKQIIKSMSINNYPTALIIHNMPIDTYIPCTPENGIRPPELGEINGKGYASEATLLGLCSMLDAQPDYDENEKDGTYINQIIPRDDEKSRKVASSNGSEVPFYAHTENIYSVPPLKFFSLLCLRGDPKVATSMIFLDNILEYIKNDSRFDASMREEIAAEITKPHFVMKSGPSFEGRLGKAVLLPILEEKNGSRIFRFNANPGRMSGISPLSQFVVDYLTGILQSPEFLENNKTSIILQQGDLLLFNNWEVMHARDAFKLDKNNWRWLQRIYMMLNEFEQ